MAFWHCCMSVVLLYLHLAFFIFNMPFFVFLFDWFLCFFGQAKTGFSWIYWKDWSWIFTEFVLFGMFLHKFHIWENYSFSDMGQNVLRQSFWMNFSLIMSLEQIYETELEISLLWVFAWCEKPLSCGSHSWTLCKNFFGSKNLGKGPKTGIFEFIDNVSTW